MDYFFMRRLVWQKVILFTGLIIFLLSGNASSFYEFEHRYIGNAAYTIAEKQLETDPQFNTTAGKGLLKDLNYLTRKVFHFHDQNPNLAQKKVYEVQGELAAAFLSLIPITFGDLSSLSADHFTDIHELEQSVARFAGYDSPMKLNLGELFLEMLGNSLPPRIRYSQEFGRIIVLRKQWLSACRWHYAKTNSENPLVKPTPLPDCFGGPEQQYSSNKWTALIRNENHKFGDEHDLRRFYHIGSDGYIRPRDELAAFERLPKYASLAASNQSHFPQQSWENFLTHHMAALENAKRYSNADSKEKVTSSGCTELMKSATLPQCFLKMALLEEAFAQHFLHDSFSSGHIASSSGSQNKEYLQQVHDSVNELGLHVAVEEMPRVSGIPSEAGRQMIGKGWIAFGDGHLLIAEAQFHRAVILTVSSASLQEVFAAATFGHHENALETCNKWIAVFPIPRDPSYTKALNNTTNFCQMLGQSSGESVNHLRDLIYYEAGHGLSPDPRVTARPFEGWKVFIAAGPSFGKFDTVQSDGNSLSKDFWSPTIAFDLGYVRTTEAFWPNYFGVGALRVNDMRTSFYGSAGYFIASPDSRFFIGYRLNVGFQVADAFTQQNRNSIDRTSFEIGVPVDVGWRIYRPLTLFLRLNYLDLTFRGLGGSQNFTGVTAETLYLGTTPVLLGVMFDLAEVF